MEEQENNDFDFYSNFLLVQHGLKEVWRTNQLGAWTKDDQMICAFSKDFIG